MLMFTWENTMQAEGMVGTPPLFIKITDPQPASVANGDLSDEDYANEILSGWGNNVKYALRSNMELIEYKFDGTMNLELLDALYYTIVDYLNPASYINREGQLIGGSQRGQLEMYATFIAGIQAELEDVMAHPVKQYLEYNGYSGYIIEVKLNRLNTQDHKLNLDRAKLLASHRIAHPNVILELCGQEGMDDEEFLKIWKLWEQAPAVKQISTTRETSANISREDLPGSVTALPDGETLSQNLENDLLKLITKAEKDLIKAVRG